MSGKHCYYLDLQLRLRHAFSGLSGRFEHGRQHAFIITHALSMTTVYKKQNILDTVLILHTIRIKDPDTF